MTKIIKRCIVNVRKPVLECDKMVMKKILVFLIMISLVLSFAGCNKTATANEPKEEAPLIISQDNTADKNEKEEPAEEPKQEEQQKENE
ncbi:MAG: hypothetical protein ACPLSX_04170, partial [Arcobacter sp.]